MGPTVGVILPKRLSASQERWSVSTIGLDSEVRGSFFVQGREFFYNPAPDSAAWLEEYEAEGVPELIGWTPAWFISFAALTNEKSSHRVIGQLALEHAQEFGGIIDFDGDLAPPIVGETERLFEEWFEDREPGRSWDAWKPAFDLMVQDLPGTVYSVPEPADDGARWVYHLADAEFMEAWLSHPHYHLVK